MSNEVTILTKQAWFTITLGDAVDVTTHAEAIEDRKLYVVGRPRYDIRVQSWDALVTCLRALDPSLTEESLRQQVLDQKTGAWRQAVMGNAGNAGNA